MTDRPSPDRLSPAPRSLRPAPLLASPDDRYIRARFDRWFPWLRFRVSTAAEMVRMADRHRARILVLASMSVPRTAVHNLSLDDPRPSEAEWQSRLDGYARARAQRNRRGQMARVDEAVRYMNQEEGNDAHES